MCALLLCACNVTVNIPVSPVEDFTFKLENGEAIVTGYTGSDLEIHIPEEYNKRPVTMIAGEAFEGYDMSLVIIPDSVKIIESMAFNDCINLKEIRLGNGVETIGSYCFSDCSQLTTVKLNEGLTTIENDAFKGCIALTSIDLPKSLTVIEEDVFLDSGLENVTLPSGLQTLEYNAFNTDGETGELIIPTDVNPDIHVKISENPGYTLFHELYLPTGKYTAVLVFNDPYNTNIATNTLDEKIQQSPPKLKLVVTENSVAHNQLKEVEQKVNIDLQKLGIYRVK